MCLGPDCSDVVDVAEKAKISDVSPLVQYARRYRSRIERIRLTGQECLDRSAALAEQLMCLHEGPHAFVIEQASDKGNREWSRRLRQRDERVSVDTGAGDERNGFLPQAERRHHGVVVGVLNKHRGVRPLEQPTKERSRK